MASISLFAVLGASDPEMDIIRDILNEAGVPFGYAGADHRRVHPGNLATVTKLIIAAKGLITTFGRN